MSFAPEEPSTLPSMVQPRGLIMGNGVRMAAAVGLGYLLGRTRKMRVALMLAGAGATGRLGKNPGVLVKQGMDLLGSSKELSSLTETVRGRLTEAGKAAAVTAVSSQVDSLSDRIEQRTRSLSAPTLPDRAGKSEGPEAAEDTGEPDETRDGPAADEEEAPAPRRRPRRAAAEESATERPRRAAGRPRAQRPPVRRTRRREQ
jgi:hypothetical protein